MSCEHNPRFSQGAAPGSGAPGGAYDPADANVSSEWLALCAKIGFTVVAIKVPCSAELCPNPGFEEDLGRELTAANLGHYDSAKYGMFLHSDGAGSGSPIIFLFCIHSAKLATALQFIKTKLAAIGLLPHVRIAHSDQGPTHYRRVVFLEDGKAGA
jgi:hypothetical protein